ncbi:MAG: hypothetical protein IPM38_15170 [Ignavibacteria bacterium]|nr:hypothetical protein [Ignavibacteria bacterium]
MNIPSKDLFNLIRSLSMNEKQYFKKYSSIHTDSADKNYLRLYYEIEEQARTGEVYDEVKIKEKFKGEKFAKQFHVTKNYLYDLILKSLASQHSHASDLTELYLIISSIHELFERGLFFQCDKLIKKGKKVAYKNEYFQELLRLLNYEQMVERQNYSSLNSKSKKYENTDTFNEVRKVTEMLNNYQDYMKLGRKAGIIMRRNLNSGEIKEFRDLIKNPLFKSETKALSYKAKMIYFFVKGQYYGEIGDPEKHFELSKHHFEFMESHPERIHENINQSVSVLHEILETCAQSNRVEDHGKYLNRLKKFYEARNDRYLKNIRHDIYQYYFIHLLLQAFLTGEIKKKSDTLMKLESDLPLYENKISRNSRLNIFYLLSEFYFLMRDYKKALYYINFIINCKESEEILELYILSAFMNLLIHYELKNFETVESLSRSLQYFVKKNKKLDKFNFDLLELLKELLLADNKKEELKAFNYYIYKEKKNEQISNKDYLVFLHVLKQWIKTKIS